MDPREIIKEAKIEALRAELKAYLNLLKSKNIDTKHIEIKIFDKFSEK